MSPDRRQWLLIAFLICAGCSPSSNSKSVVLARGRLYISQEKYDKAVETLTQGSASWPDSAEIHYECGLANERLGNLDRALEEYDAAIKLDKSMFTAHNNRAAVLRSQKKFEAAVAGFSSAIQLNPKDVLPLRNRALAYHDLGKFDLALQDLNDFARLDPASPEPLLLRGNSCLAAGRLEEARVALTRSIRIDPLYAPAWVSRAEVHRRLGDERRAEYDARRASEIKPPAPRENQEKGRTPAESSRRSTN